MILRIERYNFKPQNRKKSKFLNYFAQYRKFADGFESLFQPQNNLLWKTQKSAKANNN